VTAGVAVRFPAKVIAIILGHDGYAVWVVYLTADPDYVVLGEADGQRFLGMQPYVDQQNGLKSLSKSEFLRIKT